MLRSRYVLWQAGIEIPAGCEVHHKDGNKLNDALDNLEVKARFDHRSDHFRGHRWGKGGKVGRKYSAEAKARLSAARLGKPKSRAHAEAISRATTGKHKTCSLCGLIGNRKTHPNHPSHQEAANG